MSTQADDAVSGSIARQIAEDLGAREGQVEAAVRLLDGGATVPFIARYRKEVTEGLDDAQLRSLEERLGYLRELEQRRAAILESVQQQGLMTEELAEQIRGARTKARLEDVYLPYKPRRRTRAQIAREAGLEPLADLLITEPWNDPAAVAPPYVDAEKGVADVSAALDGARSILVERFSEHADLVGALREEVWSRGRLVSAVREGKEGVGATFADYFDKAEALTSLPSHRILAMFRGEKEGVLALEIDPDPEPVEGGPSRFERRIATAFGIRDRGRPGDAWLAETVRWAWRTRILVHLELDLRARLRLAAEDEAVRVFAGNLKDLLLAAPAGTRATMGLDPGLRTGVKVAVVDATGKVVATHTVFPHPPHRRWEVAIAELAALCARFGVELIAIGNGTASRETDRLAAELIAGHPQLGLTRVMVSEAGASVYSASAYASAELPELDVSLRGAVSIARRLQDPLAELVKIDPKSIGVGQYQHDLAEGRLSHSLDAVVEDAVNAVGVDVNTASAPLLRRVSGVSESLATLIVEHRDSHGPFRSRRALHDVPRLGPKAFEQCAGFLRIRDGEDPLDASSVHPEAYPLVRTIAAAVAGGDVRALVGNGAALRRVRAGEFADDRFGLPTVTDILAELEKPGRDPRPAFRTATFAEGVETLADLSPGMVLEGVVTNVAAFGAFVDIGVHQDGLVHVSALSHRFVKDPRDVVKSGDVVRVKVMSIDVARSRIGLTLRLDDDPAAPAPSAGRSRSPGRAPGGNPSDGRPSPGRAPVGNPSDGRPSPGRAPVGNPSDGRPSPGRASGGNPSDGRPSPGRAPVGNPSDGTTASGRPSGGGPAGGKPAGGKPSGGKLSGGKPAGGKLSGGKLSGGKPRSGGAHQGDRPRGPSAPSAPPPSGAIADAFRRAGFTVDDAG
ncbi:MAG: Tex-like N-terminal domain-containing protein [Kineosporiaceae bacterium]